MLSEEEREAIAQELEHYRDPRAACVEAMKIVQHRRGWVSDDALAAIAELLRMSVHELEGVATYYNLIFRRPVGRHVILLCDSVVCWMVGYPAVREHLTERLGIDFGETTADGRFTLLPMPCLGSCDRAPAMLVDRDLHRDLAPERIDAILERYS